MFSSTLYQFLSFAHLYHCLPSCSRKSLICLRLRYKLLHFWLLSRSLFSFLSRSQMETTWFSFPRSYRLKKRHNVKEFFRRFLQYGRKHSQSARPCLVSRHIRTLLCRRYTFILSSSEVNNCRLIRCVSDFCMPSDCEVRALFLKGCLC